MPNHPAESAYAELKDGAPKVADDMLREWRAKRAPVVKPVKPFSKLVDEAQAKGDIYIQSRTLYHEAETYGFEAHWVHFCCFGIVPISHSAPCNHKPKYFYVPKDVTCHELQEALPVFVCCDIHDSPCRWCVAHIPCCRCAI